MNSGVRFVVSHHIFLLVSHCFVLASPGRADLVAHWRLGEGEGQRFQNQADRDFDGYLLSPAFSVEWVEVVPNDDGFGPEQEHAVHFNGVNSGIQTDFPGIGGSRARTVTFWVKSTATGLEQSDAIVAWGDSLPGGRWHMRFNQWSSCGQLGAIRTTCDDGHAVGTKQINDGQWHHVACVFPEGAEWASSILFFIDGEPDPTHQAADVRIHTVIGDTAEPVTIGMKVREDGVTRRFFSGTIADVRIYDEALNGEEIQGILPPLKRPAAFLRGDANTDANKDLSDAVFLLSYLFLGGTSPSCEKAADADDSGVLDITDAVYLLNYLFLGGTTPNDPFPDCGLDETTDGLTCESFPPCEEP
jgi:hypothetical protein